MVFSRFSSDVAKSGFEFLTELATYVNQKNSPELASLSGLEAFMQVGVSQSILSSAGIK